MGDTLRILAMGVYPLGWATGFCLAQIFIPAPTLRARLEVAIMGVWIGALWPVLVAYKLGAVCLAQILQPRVRRRA